jgi:hypothetical protein
MWRRQDKADGLGGRFALGGGVARLAPGAAAAL